MNLSPIAILFLLSIAPAWGLDSRYSGNTWLDHLKRDLLPFWTTEAALNNKPVALYYAFAKAEMARASQPYYYSGQITDVELESNDSERHVQKVTFSNIR